MCHYPCIQGADKRCTATFIQEFPCLWLLVMMATSQLNLVMKFTATSCRPNSQPVHTVFVLWYLYWQVRRKNLRRIWLPIVCVLSGFSLPKSWLLTSQSNILWKEPLWSPLCLLLLVSVPRHVNSWSAHDKRKFCVLATQLVEMLE